MIRKFEASDIDMVMDIWLESVIQAHSFVDASYWIGAQTLVREKYILDLQTLIYEEEGVILGFISIWSTDTIGALFVDNMHSRYGIGTKLVDRVFKDHDSLGVAVYEKNKGAVTFFEKQGFVFDYKQTDINTGETEHVLKRQI